ncbi:unnamed protein product [Rhizopus stolonifer]
MSQPTKTGKSLASPVPEIIPRYVPDDTTQTTESVVHVTITQAGTVVYTYTATSYSYIPSYSTVSSIKSSNTPTSVSLNNKSGNGTNMNAIIGGAVGGGLALIALIGFLFIFLRQKKSRKSHLYGRGYAVDNESHINYTCAQISDGMEPSLTNKGLVPRHFIAPLQGVSGGTRESKHLGDGTSEELIGADYNNPRGYFVNRTEESINSNSIPSTAVESNPMLASYDLHRHVPNEIGSSYPEERHVPHLKEHEPPHFRD